MLKTLRYSAFRQQRLAKSGGQAVKLSQPPAEERLVSQRQLVFRQERWSFLKKSRSFLKCKKPAIQ
jgi:hypothetical protein